MTTEARRAGPLLGVLLLASALGSCGLLDPLYYLDPPPAFTWERKYGGIGEDVATSVQQTPDGGFVLVGTTDSYGAGADDVWLLKTDASGDEVWSRTYGGAGEDRGRCVRQTPDGGFIIVGTTNSHGAGAADVWRIKTDGSGLKKWDRTFGGVEDDEGASVGWTADGGYIVTGSTYSFGAAHCELYLIKTDASGVLEWSTTFGDVQTMGESVCQTSDGGYLVAGSSTTDSFADAYLAKTESDGNELWSRAFGDEFPDYGCHAVETSDGGYALAGYTRSGESGDFDSWLIKTDASGTEEWSRSYGYGGWDQADCVEQTSEGGFALFGMTGNHRFVWLTKTDASGTEEWSKMFGLQEDQQQGLGGQQTADGGYVICGWTESLGAGGRDAYLIYYRP